MPKPPFSPTHGSLVLFAGACVLLGLGSCESGTSMTASPEAQLCTVEFRAVNAYRRPDSIGWVSGGESGAATWTLDSSSGRFHVEFRPSEQPGSDTAFLHAWRHGIRTDVIPMTGSGRLAIAEPAIRKDSMAMGVLKQHEADATVEPGKFPRDRKGVHTTFARMLLSGAPAVAAYPTRIPLGVDTALLRKEVCRSLPGSGLAWADLKDANTGRPAFLDLLATCFDAGGVSAEDSLALFPKGAIRVAQAIGAERDLVAGGDEVALSGKFRWDARLVVLDAAVLQGTDTVAGGFSISLAQPRSLADSVWDLSGRAYVRARPGVMAGGYTLVVTARDASGERAVSRVSILVEEPPPGMPRLRIVSPDPLDTAVVAFSETAVDVRVSVSNPRDIDEASFRIGGVVPSKESDTVWSARVPLAADGSPTFVGVRVRGIDGQVGSDFLVARRAIDGERPQAIRGAGASDRSIPFDSASARVSWKITDNHYVDEVTIDGVPAERDGDTWYRELELEEGAHKIRMVARDSTGNTTTDSITLRRLVSPGYPVLKATESTKSREVTYPTRSVNLAWIVLNPGCLARVTIGDVLVEGRDGAFARDVPLAIGLNAISIVAEDTLGTQVKSIIKIVRAGETEVPQILDGKATAIAVAGKARVSAAWTVSDNGDVRWVRIEDEEVQVVDGRYGRTLDLPLDSRWVRIHASDSAGNESWDSLPIALAPDESGPEVAPASPSAAPLEVPQGTESVTIGWRVDDAYGVSKVLIEGVEVEGRDGLYERKVSLKVGTNQIKVEAFDAAGNSSSGSRVVVRADEDAPVVTLKDPADTLFVGSGKAVVTLAWRVEDLGGVAWTGVGQAQARDLGESLYEVAIDLTGFEGDTAMKVVARDPAGHESDRKIVVRRDILAPAIAPGVGTLDTLLPMSKAGTKYELSWTLSDDDKISSIKIQGKVVAVAQKLTYTIAALAVGSNRVLVEVVDRSGNVASAAVDIAVANRVSAIAMGGDFGALVDGSGRLSVWGKSDLAGVSNMQAFKPPAEVGRSAYRDVAASIYHLAAIRADGTVLVTDYRGDTIKEFVDEKGVGRIRAGRDVFIFLRPSDSSASVWQRSGSTWTKSGSLAAGVPPKILDAACGDNFCLAILPGGILQGWGTLPGVIAADTKARRVSAYGNHAAIVRLDDSLILWNPANYSSTPSKAFVATSKSMMLAKMHELHGLAVGTDGVVSGWGYNGSSQAAPPVKALVSPIKDLVLGYRSNVVLLEDGTVWGWGANNGQISYPKVYEAP